MEIQLGPYLERVNHVLQRTPLGQRIAQYPVTFTIGLLTVIFHLAALMSRGDSVTGALAVSPSATLMNGMIWTLVTSSLLEKNTGKFVICLLPTLAGTFYLEQQWGSPALAKFLSLIAASSSMLSALAFIVVYMAVLNDEIFFSHVYGLGGLIVALAVGIISHRWQKIGDQDQFPFQKRYFVLLPLAIAFYSIAGFYFFPLHDVLLVVFSMFTSMGYLRSNDFGFSLFFQFLDKSNQTTSEAKVPVAAGPLVALGGPIESPNPTKERYRARGFQLLDKKLAELEAAPEASLDLDDKSDTVSNKV